MRRATGAIGVSAPILAAISVLVSGMVTPGYDAWTRTISRLAEAGAPASIAIDLVILVVGLASLGLAGVLTEGAAGGRVLLGAAGIGLLGAAVMHLDPASAPMTAAHRAATVVAMVGLAGAPLVFGSRGYGWSSVVLGTAAAGMLLAGLALLPTGFSDWGLWERIFLAAPMAWLVLISAPLLRSSRIEPTFSSMTETSSWAASVSADETMNAPAAAASRSGS